MIRDEIADERNIFGSRRVCQSLFDLQRHKREGIFYLTLHLRMRLIVG